MDDVTVSGSPTSVKEDCETIRIEGESLGLKLNVKKCELIHHPRTVPDPYFQDFVHLEPIQGSSLGALILHGVAMDAGLDRNCEDLVRARSRLKTLTSHDALILLRASFSAPKVMHTMRSAPCAGHTALDRFDNLLKQGLSSIMNVALSD